MTGRGADRATLAKFVAFAAATTLLTLFIAQQIIGSGFDLCRRAGWGYLTIFIRDCQAP